MLVSDRDPRFTSDFWTSLHAALGTSLIFGSPYHHNTNSRTERVNAVIADVLRSFVEGRQDDWPTLIPLVEFAVNDSASPIGHGYTAFYADRGQHPRRPLSTPGALPAGPELSGADVARQLDADRVELTRPQGDMVLENGTWMNLKADKGIFVQKSNNLDLTGNVTLYRDDGTTLTTPNANIDIKTGIAAGSDPVHIEGPFGRIDAQGFTAADKGATLNFSGPAHAILNGGQK